MLLLRYVDGGVGKVLYNSQEDEEEGVNGVTKSLKGLDDGNIKEDEEDVHFDEEH
jgi:hypothetical protein